MSAGLLKTLLEAEAVLDRINGKLGTVMAKAQDFAVLLDGINQETDRLAVQIQELMDLVSDSGLTGSEEEEILSRLQSIHDRLGVIGSDPAEPIPPE